MIFSKIICSSQFEFLLNIYVKPEMECISKVPNKVSYLNFDGGPPAPPATLHLPY